MTPTPASTPAHTAHTQRERQALRLLAGGLRNAEVAEQMAVTVNTVEAHLKRAYRKLGAGNRLQALRRAVEGGFLGEGERRHGQRHHGQRHHGQRRGAAPARPAAPGAGAGLAASRVLSREAHAALTSDLAIAFGYAEILLRRPHTPPDAREMAREIGRSAARATLALHRVCGVPQADALALLDALEDPPPTAVDD